MTDDRSFDRMARAWLELGPNEAPDRAVSAVLQAVEATPQVRPLSQRLPWRYSTVNRLPISAAVTVAVVIVLGGFLFMRSNDTTGVGGPSPSASGAASATPSASTRTGAAPLPDPISVTPEAAVAVTKPFTMAFDGKALWVLSETVGSLVRIDPATNEAGTPVEIAGSLQGVSGDADGVWATSWSTGRAYHVDPDTQEILASVETGLSKGILATDGAVWVANTRAGTVTRIDPATNEIVATIVVGSKGAGGPNWLTSGFGSIWVGVPLDSSVVRIDPATNEVQATIASNTTPCGGLLSGADAVWITSCAEGKSASRIDPSTNSAVGAVYLGGYAQTPTLIDGVPWASIDRGGGTGGAIVRINPLTNEVDRVLSPGPDFTGGLDILVAAGSVWVLDGANDQVLRLPLSAFGS